MATRAQKQKRIERTAYHEAGHVLLAYLLRKAFKYVTIEPDGDSLGYVLYYEFSESFSNKDFLLLLGIISNFNLANTWQLGIGTTKEYCYLIAAQGQSERRLSDRSECKLDLL